MTNSWAWRNELAADFMIPWIESAVPLAGKTVLEYGCGNGPVACAFGPRVGRHLGVDIDAAVIAAGQAAVAERQLDNVELRHVPLDGILASVEGHAGEIDVFLFYAVLEHMTVAERLEVLELARGVVRPDGAIVICETPNRLIPWDWHSSQAPFVAQLPDELVLRYHDRAPRQEFVETIANGLAAGWDAGQEALTRYGRGMSFHELELVFGDLSAHVIQSNWEPALMPRRDIHVEELALARMLDQTHPELPPAFSRYWLDVVLRPTPTQPPRMLRPWALHTLDSPHARWPGTEAVWLPEPGAQLVVQLPQPSERLVAGVLPATPGPVHVRLEQPDGELLLGRTVESEGPPGYATFQLPGAAQTLAISLDAPGQVMFVGYDR